MVGIPSPFFDPVLRVVRSLPFTAGRGEMEEERRGDDGSGVLFFGLQVFGDGERRDGGGGHGGGCLMLLLVIRHRV